MLCSLVCLLVVLDFGLLCWFGLLYLLVVGWWCYCVNLGASVRRGLFVDSLEFVTFAGFGRFV